MLRFTVPAGSGRREGLRRPGRRTARASAGTHEVQGGGRPLDGDLAVGLMQDGVLSIRGFRHGSGPQVLDTPGIGKDIPN